MFQFTVRATDSGRPPRSTDVEVTIFIIRAQLPQFINTPYATTVQENSVNNTQIYTVTARDQDGQVSDAIISLENIWLNLTLTELEFGPSESLFP